MKPPRRSPNVCRRRFIGVAATDLDRLRADARRMSGCLTVMSEAQVGAGSFRFVSAEVATTAETLRRRFS